MTKRSATGKGLIRLNAKLNAVLIRELMDGARTAEELRKITGMGARTTSDYLMAMYHLGCIRIAGWQRDTSGKQSIRIYEFGNKPDAKKVPGKREARLTSVGRSVGLSVFKQMTREVERLAA